MMDILDSSSFQEMSNKICYFADRGSFAVPSCILFDLNKFIRVMCRIDYKTLESEMKTFMSRDLDMPTNIQPISIVSFEEVCFIIKVLLNKYRLNTSFLFTQFLPSSDISADIIKSLVKFTWQHIYISL